MSHVILLMRKLLLIEVGELPIPPLKRRLDNDIVPKRGYQSRQKANEHAWHFHRIGVGHKFVIGDIRVKVMIGVIGNLKPHETR